MSLNSVRWRPNLALFLSCGVAVLLNACGGGGSSSGSSLTGSGSGGPVVSTGASLQVLSNQPPHPGYLSLLLTDGSVMVQASPQASQGISANQFYRLTPDIHGDYAKGSWRAISSPPAGYAPYAGGQAVLADGRVVFLGGEYNQDNYAIPFAPSGLSNMSAVYDPLTDQWAMIAAPAGLAYIGDAPSVVLPDGRFIFGDKLGKGMWALDPASLSWSLLAANAKQDNFAEEGLTLLPNGNLLVVDMASAPLSEHYVPSLGQWVSDGAIPVGLTSPTDYPQGITYGPAPLQLVGGVSYGPGPAGVYFPPGETGPAILRPDGSVFATGAAASNKLAGHTAIYTPGAKPSDAGTWKAGPDFPVGDNAGDSCAALLPSGNVLVAGVTGSLYEFDGSQLKQTVAAPAGFGSNGNSYFLLPLPSGQVLVMDSGGKAQVYTPTGTAQPGWAPTVSQVASSLTRGQTFSISGTQFNGLSQAASFGDELSAATNYPLLRLTNAATGHVFYARTHHHSSMGVATGSAIVSTQFDVPLGAETGASMLQVIANGIASAPVPVTIN